MELGPASDLLLGRDHLAALGIGVTKLPFATAAATAVTAPLPAEDEADYVPPRVFGSTPDYDKYRDKVLRLLDAEITANQDIPLGTFCNVPGSEVHIITLEGKRCYRLQCPLPHAVKPAVTKQAQEWLAAGIIGPAPPGCDWNSPLTHSYKKLPDGRKIDIRTCFDARGVNVILVVVDKHPLPLIKETHTGFKGKRFVSALDLKWSFHQFMVALCDRSKLSFTWEGVQYCFNGCPFGLTPVSHHVQRVIQGALRDLYYCCRVFIDDITIFSDTLEQHVEYLRAVLSRQRD
ncbi:hypothetical protein PF005_g19840 [Phytophthora fragariae]|uniref:Reverse transcriptase domain-containing protein n=1 Tax=Phytophthora fragariae TaxID=53985 RepID=A0A6A3E5U8_9STRA|nr:hypothetical protein PF009_g22061 [Phytophthora fragariae]KAE8985004.1 hypothetical protein PF011_g20558 [Phytophthora fragariae]KAE9095754.1 hypothetical protein PF007_g17270 [Phytophthora fragariae]KAE9105689.1 hypothetical protein PF006_g21561 [Phytophthora fragariae]KAE9188973.1 hypothetical protein PF005_g19840 [Phytophthora fragariae]